MGYYIRILGTSDPNIHIDEIIKRLNIDGLSAKFALDQNERPENWTLLRVANIEGEDIIDIERNPVLQGELGQEELDEFRDEIIEHKPLSAVKWLGEFFDKVKVIYAFQLPNIAFEESNFKVVNAIKACIRSNTGGVLQADYEGFSNEDGYHILWQFSDDVTGDWEMSILNPLGQWINFTMDLGDSQQRAEFLNGTVPKGAKIL